VQNHAVLTSEGSGAFAIGLRGRGGCWHYRQPDHERAENPVPMLAMLTWQPTCRRREGRKVNAFFRTAAEAAGHLWPPNLSQTADEYLDKLVAEFEGVDAAEGEEGEAAEADVAEEGRCRGSPTS
jgi:hypothetical protein